MHQRGRGGFGGQRFPPNGSWVPSSDGAYPSHGTIKVSDNPLIYIARAKMEDNSMVPGKLCPTERGCWVPWNNAEKKMTHYEVFVSNSVQWVPINCGQPIPAKAVEGGYKGCGECGARVKLYIGRAFYNTTMTPGYVHAGSRQLVHSSGHKNVTKSSYELLCYM